MTKAEARRQAVQERAAQRAKARKHRRRSYPSDLTRAQWALIKPLVVRPHPGAGRPVELNMRVVLNAIFYLVRTGWGVALFARTLPAPQQRALLVRQVDP